MRALEYIRGHVTFELPYDFSYQMIPMVLSFIIYNAIVSSGTLISRGKTSWKKRSMDEKTGKTFSLEGCVKFPAYF